jgi:hypothetical protein
MDTNEYLSLSEQTPELPDELDHFIRVWIESRCPDMFKELESRFSHLESEIYAAREAALHDRIF